MRTHWIPTTAALLIAFGLMVLATGCKSQPASTEDDEAVIVNTHCPIMGAELDRHAVSEDLTRQWDGKTIGFCCAGCPAAWDELSDEEKREKLEAVTAGEPHRHHHD